MRFTTIHFTNAIPQVSKDYCRAALIAKTSESSDCVMVQHNDTRGYVICADPMMDAAVDIKRAVNSFPILLLPLFPRFNLGSFRNEEISGSWYHGQVNIPGVIQLKESR